MYRNNLERLISLTFDEDSNVRKKTALELAKVDDPGALFALLELTHDKDESVRDAAIDILEKNRKNKPKEDLMSFSELFSYSTNVDKKSKSKPGKIITDKKRKLLHSIELIFERKLGKNSDLVKKKMMPSLEKAYFNALSEGKSSKREGRREGVQKFLLNYLTLMKSSNNSEIYTNLEAQPSNSSPTLDTSDNLDNLDNIDNKEDSNPNVQIEQEGSLDSLDQVSSHNSSLTGGNIERALNEVLNSEVNSTDDKEHEHENFLKNVPDSLFKKAYEIMMYSGGDKSLMKKEMKRMIRLTEQDIKLAFKLAHQKFKENKITKLTDIVDKMRNITTDVLTIKSKEVVEFKKPRSTKYAVRFLLQDSNGGEGVLYLFDGKGDSLVDGLNIKIEKGYAKVINDETSLILGSRGSIYIVV